ncbi:MAG: hypothetical protein ACI4R6_02800 [Lachnospiraceae bacterium]
MRVYPLSEHYLDSHEEQNTIILGYARLREEEISRGITLLSEAFNEKNM